MEAWPVIGSSAGVRNTAAAGFSIGRDLLGRAGERLAQDFGTSDRGARLRRVA